MDEPPHPMSRVERFIGRPGTYVKLTDTVRGFATIVDGQLDHIPEQLFYMAGGIDEVIEHAAKAGHDVGMVD